MKLWAFAAKLYSRGALPIGSGMVAIYAADELLQVPFLPALLFGGGTGLIAHLLAEATDDVNTSGEAVEFMLRGALAAAFAPVAFTIVYLLVSRAGTFPALPLSMIAAIIGAVVAYGLLSIRKKHQPPGEPYTGADRGGVREAIMQAHLAEDRRRRAS